jgi:hypothetical protein
MDALDLNMDDGHEDEDFLASFGVTLVPTDRALLTFLGKTCVDLFESTVETGDSFEISASVSSTIPNLPFKWICTQHCHMSVLPVKDY